MKERFLKLNEDLYVSYDQIRSISIDRRFQDICVILNGANGDYWIYSKHETIDQAKDSLRKLVEGNENDILLDNLVIPKRLRFALKRLGCKTLGDAKGITEDSLRGINNVGNQSITDWKCLIN